MRVRVWSVTIVVPLMTTSTSGAFIEVIIKAARADQAIEDAIDLIRAKMPCGVTCVDVTKVKLMREEPV